ncbi:MAG: CueP family metal-binding protein [Candidatus Izemoplasma sp.]
MKKILFVLMIGTVFILSSCSSIKKEDILVELGLGGLTAKEILNGIASNEITISNYTISVTDDVLLINYDNKNISLEMPKDEFYISVAPYIDMTHECFFHSPTECRAELSNESFYITLIDLEGNIVLDSYYESLNNGFIDFWLPRDIEGVLSITYGDLTSVKMISTFSGDATCETTFKLT